MSENKPKCNSFVFLDIESTGIPFREADGGKTRITEISFISISREILSKIHDDLPRIVRKLTIPVNPCKLISDEVTRITGIDNLMLENENPFDAKKAASIKSFLEECKPPICLVAHNGYRFDFPLMKEELLKFLNIIPEGTRCGDTLYAFRDLSNRPDFDETTLTFNPFINEVDLQLVKGAVAVQERLLKKSENGTNIDNVDMAEMRMLNETTPLSQKILPAPSPVNIRKRRLSFESENNDGDASPVVNKSFSLTNVYFRIFGRKPSMSHRAEDDTVTMMKCCLKFGQPIVDWFDENSLAYSDIQPVYTRG